MDFKKLCKLYVANKDRIVDKKLMQERLYISYELLQYKKNKLKTGALKFTFKQLYYDEYLISSWFALESAAQDPNTFEKKVKATLKLLDWAWDWPTILLLGTILGTLLNYYGSRLSNFYNVYITGDYTQDVLRVGLESIFNLTDNKLINNSNLIPSLGMLRDSIVDLILYLNLF